MLAAIWPFVFSINEMKWNIHYISTYMRLYTMTVWYGCRSCQFISPVSWTSRQSAPTSRTTVSQSASVEANRSYSPKREVGSLLFQTEYSQITSEIIWYIFRNNKLLNIFYWYCYFVFLNFCLNFIWIYNLYIKYEFVFIFT